MGGRAYCRVSGGRVGGDQEIASGYTALESDGEDNQGSMPLMRR
jgi:hypothetical protein